tara:strand:+ start:60 stop:596 length:537 start_codon:yes stop_codon:yes gene_type:complete
VGIDMKECFKCKKTFELSAFHKHKEMKDGRLNKCKHCVVKDMADWRINNPGCRAKEHARKRDKEGFRTKAEHDAERKKNAIGRRATSFKYGLKRRRFMEVQVMSELDEFVITEAAILAQLREDATGVKWHVDHTVPIHHKEACGLHCYSNIQVVPAAWNVRKGNRNMASYWPKTTAGY